MRHESGDRHFGLHSSMLFISCSEQTAHDSHSTLEDAGRPPRRRLPRCQAQIAQPNYEQMCVSLKVTLYDICTGHEKGWHALALMGNVKPRLGHHNAPPRRPSTDPWIHLPMAIEALKHTACSRTDRRPSYMWRIPQVSVTHLFACGTAH